MVDVRVVGQIDDERSDGRGVGGAAADESGACV